MGYSKELFQDPTTIDAEFICSICRDILQDPCLVVPCEHVYCKDCIVSWTSTLKNTCPLDRELMTGVRGPHRSFLNFYNRLRLKCAFHTAGCGSVLDIDQIEQHQSTCDHNPELTHPCAKDCGALIKNSEVATHDCIAYLKAINSALKNEVEAKNKEIETLKQQKKAVQDKFDSARLDWFKMSRETKKTNEVARVTPPELPNAIAIAISSNRRIIPVPRSIRRIKQHVFFELMVNDCQAMGRLVIELRDDVVPKTTEIFHNMCIGLSTGETKYSYRGSTLSITSPGDGILITPTDSARAKAASVHGAYLPLENFNLSHDGPGVVSLVSAGGRGTRFGYSFVITTKKCESANGKHMVIGCVINGMNIIQDITKNCVGWFGGMTKIIRVNGCGHAGHTCPK